MFFTCLESLIHGWAAKSEDSFTFWRGQSLEMRTVSRFSVVGQLKVTTVSRPGPSGGLREPPNSPFLVEDLIKKRGNLNLASGGPK